jgi:capsular polysaccharide biosynthesis protein
VTDSRTQRHVLGTALRRFGAIALLVAVVCGVLTTWLVDKVSTPTYTAEGTFIVPIVPPPATGTVVLPGTPARPTSPGDAQVFAKNYSVVVSQDQALLTALAGPTQMSVTDLGKAITAVNVPSSAAIKVTFTAESRQAVMAYFKTMQTIVTAPNSPTGNLPAGNLQVLRQPESITTQRGLTPVAPFVGVLMGVLLGVSTAVLLERLNPQVRSADDLRAMVAWPVLDLSERAPESRYESIVLRVLQGRPDVHRAAVACTAGVSREFTSVLAERLARAEADLRRSGRLPAAEHATRWEALGRLPDPLAERGAQDAGAVVLAVPHHARLGATTDAMQRLEDLAADDVVVVLGTRNRATTVPREGRTTLGQPETGPAAAGAT